VQKILVFWFSNPLFNDIMDSIFVESVKIIISESIGVELRANYYEKTGALRDMVQNHMMQILSLIAMETPKSMNADDIRDKKVEVIKHIRKTKPEDIFAGQYGKGIIDGKSVAAYREEKSVGKTSNTETFAKIRAYIENERWKGVPFYLITGKRLKSRHAEIKITLKDRVCGLFDKSDACNPLPNIITIRIQPDEGISIKFNVKIPGKEMALLPITVDHCHKCIFDGNTAEAYENLLKEVILGNQSLFIRWDEVLASWKFIDDARKIMLRKYKKIPLYKSGSDGSELFSYS